MSWTMRADSEIMEVSEVDFAQARNCWLSILHLGLPAG